MKTLLFFLVLFVNVQLASADDQGVFCDYLEAEQLCHNKFEELDRYLEIKGNTHEDPEFQAMLAEANNCMSQYFDSIDVGLLYSNPDYQKFMSGLETQCGLAPEQWDNYSPEERIDAIDCRHEKIDNYIALNCGLS